MKKIIIPHSRPTLGRAEIAAAAKVLKSGFLAQGKQAAGLEAETARLHGLKYAAAVSSGTAALYLALRAMGAGPGKKVILPSYVCSSLWHAVKFCGADPVLADSNPTTFNIDPDSVKKKLGRGTAVIIAPHMFGLPAEIRELLRLGVPVLEDCALALGARADGKPVGSYGAAAALSFYATKMLAGGEGGLVLSKNSAVISRVKSLRKYDGLPPTETRFNFKLTDLQAAVIRVQLARLPEFIAKRAALAARYDSLLPDIAGLPERRPGRVYHRYIVTLPENISAATAEKQMEKLGVMARKPVSRPLHLDVSCSGKFPGAEKAWKSALSLPLYPGMSLADCKFVSDCLRKTLA